VKYGTIAHRHEDWNPWGSWERLRLLNEGGYEILEPCNAKRFIPKAPNETEERYTYRLGFASYVNYLSSVIGYLVGSLFTATPQVQAASDADNRDTPGDLPDPKFYPEFSRDCDLAGNPFSQLLYEAVSGALLYRKALIGVDLPVAAPVENRAQEEAVQGGRAWLTPIPVGQMTDWVMGAGDRLEACVLHEVKAHRPTIEDPPGKLVECFRLWQMQAGFAVWTEYQTAPRDVSDPAPDETMEVARTVEPTVTSFRRIPIQVLQFAKELWVGNKAGPLNEEHWRRRSELAGALDRTLQAVPFIKRGPEIGAIHDAMPSETQQNPNRGADFQAEARRRGFVAIGGGDEIGFASPPTGGYALGMAEKKEVVEEIYRTVHAMAQSLSNTASTVQRSADSKREDRQSTAVVLDAVAETVRPFATQVYDTVSEARGEDVIWVCHGLDAYDRDDRGALVEESVSLESVKIPSVTWEKAQKKQLAFATVPGLSPTEKAQVAKEIDEGVDEMDHVREELAKHPPPPPPGAGAAVEEDDERETVPPPAAGAPPARPPSPQG
jgi:hypothetical protein